MTLRKVLHYFIVDGSIISSPSKGYRKTTNFIFNCLNWTDDNSNNLLYQFSYIEANTSNNIIIQNYSSVSEATYTFDVRYYQVPSTNITVYCTVMDGMNAINSTSTVVNLIFI
jgi:hypothetical protein